MTGSVKVLTGPLCTFSGDQRQTLGRGACSANISPLTVYMGHVLQSHGRDAFEVVKFVSVEWF